MTWCTGLCLLISAWLTQHGYSPAQRDAVLTYIHGESDFQPCAESRLGAYLPQWAGQRRRAVHRALGPNCPPWERQLEYMDRELRTESAYAPFWYAPPGRELWELRERFGRGR